MPEHPNVSLARRVAAAIQSRDIASATDVLAADVVWHYFNPRLPDLAGDYAGLSGIRTLFEKLEALSGGTFAVEPVSATPAGDQLLVTHGRIKLRFENRNIETDAVVVWRIRDGRIVEVWDIPAV